MKSNKEILKFTQIESILPNTIIKNNIRANNPIKSPTDFTNETSFSAMEGLEEPYIEFPDWPGDEAAKVPIIYYNCSFPVI